MSSPLLKANWPVPAHIHAVTTLVNHPYSEHAFNLSPFRGEPKHAQLHHQILTQTLNLQADLRFLKQVHGTDVVKAPYEQGLEADGCWTDKANYICAVLTADCLPVLLTDLKGSVVCALHAGWKGLAGQIIARGVQQIQQVSQSPLMAWLGPAIGPCHFQVGPEVRDAFLSVDELHESAFLPDWRKEGYYLADLYKIARQQLQRLNVEHVYGGGFCTYSEHDRFFSHRRDPECGRMATLIWKSTAA